MPSSTNRFVPRLEELEPRSVASRSPVAPEAPVVDVSRATAHGARDLLHVQHVFAELHHAETQRHAPGHGHLPHVEHPHAVHVDAHALDHVFAEEGRKEEAKSEETEFRPMRKSLPRPPLSSKLSRDTMVQYLNGFMDFRQFLEAGASPEDVEYAHALKEALEGSPVSVVDSRVDMLAYPR